MMQSSRMIPALIAIVIVLLSAAKAEAGVADMLRGLVNSWQSSSLGYKAYDAVTDGAAPEVDDDSSAAGEGGASTGDKKGGAGASGMCVVPQQPAVMRCEIGSGFLCVDTPDGGVSTDFVMIRGTIDRQGSVLASLRIAVQSDYTKQVSYVQTDSPSQSDCWAEGISSGNFCLDAQGRFLAKAALGAAGPYTVSVSASRLSGESVEKKVRTSKVKSPELSAENISFDPDITSEPNVEGTLVNATVELIGNCSFCDFIGAGTGAVTVTVENKITDSNGNTRKIDCATTVEQGGQGKYVIGVPVGSGKNELTVSACNAASGKDCVKVGGYSFGGRSGEAELNTIDPPPMPIYDSLIYPIIKWRFTLGGGIECATLRLNREEAREVCSEGSGEFKAELHPRVGINVVTVGSKESPEEFAWTFGWGRASSPFSNSSGAVEVENAASVGISSHAVNAILIPFINNYLGSDEFKELTARFAEAPQVEEPRMAKAADVDATGSAVDTVEIEGCEPAGTSSGLLTKFGGATIGAAKIGDVVISDGKISLSAYLNDLRATLMLHPDTDKDGIGDKSPMPLVLGLKKAKLDLIIEAKKGEGGDTFVIGSPHTDCDYKDKSYCSNAPASLIVDNLEGNATKRGSIVYCDVEKADADAKEACHAINSLNAQTAVIAEKVLDSINSTIHCAGSRALTSLVRNDVAFKIPFGCRQGADCGTALGLFDFMELPLSVKLSSIPDVSGEGISVGVNLAVGNSDFFSSVPSDYRQVGYGVVVAQPDSVPPLAAMQGDDVGFAATLDIVNSILYAAASRGDGLVKRGAFDFDIHEKFFDKFRFDFVEECDAFVPISGVKEKPSALCYIRPRVMELLGSALTGYGYFQPKQPLMLALRGNRSLGPRISISSPADIASLTATEDAASGAAESTGKVVEIELGGVLMSFYALEVDASKDSDSYGNLPIKTDANGVPVILSMRPEQSDPWKGPIVSFDLTLLLAIELSDAMPSPDGEVGSVMKARILADKTRLVVSPVAGSNVTTIPSKKLISNLAEQIMTALTQYSTKESAFTLRLPEGFSANAQAGDNLFAKFGLRSISWGKEGLSLSINEDNDSIYAGISAIVEQVIHVGGVEKVMELK